jgi:DNA-binding response OmpR family regulator
MFCAESLRAYMQFLLTDNEAVEFFRAAVRRTDGMLLFDVPANHLLENSERRPRLTFTHGSRVVHWEGRSARLSEKEFDLLCHVHKHGRVSFEDAQDAVWHKQTSDATLRNTCSRISTRLLNADIPFAILTRTGGILLEEVLS